MFAASAFAQTKPVVFISGEGNTSTQNGITNKHDQTIEMAQDLLKSCPAVTITLSDQLAPDYFISLNREGYRTVFGEMGASQIMVLNAAKGIIYAGGRVSVGKAVKDACLAIALDWRIHGKLPAPVPEAVPQPVTPAPVQAEPVVPVPATPAATPAPVATTPQMKDVALVIHTTKSADKWLTRTPGIKHGSNRLYEGDTVDKIQSDTLAYLKGKGLSIGTAEDSRIQIVLIIDRPMGFSRANACLGIKIQALDSGIAAGNVLCRFTRFLSGKRSSLRNVNKKRSLLLQPPRCLKA